ncbi:MAG: P-II family nitrogen regulator [Firmicutes bacterium]|nr:P-II family nitrogen regulator [Bacillota bacterium]
MSYEAIFVVLPRGTADSVMATAKKAGAKGGTVFLARGTGAKEAKTFFGLTVEEAKEILFVLTERQETDRILQTIIDAAHLENPGSGIAFVLDIRKTVGLVSRQPGVDPSN